MFLCIVVCFQRNKKPPFSAVGIKDRQVLCSSRSLKAILSSALSTLFLLYVHLGSDSSLPSLLISGPVFITVSSLLRKPSAFTKIIFASPVVFWQYPIANALDRGYYCFNLTGNIEDVIV